MFVNVYCNKSLWKRQFILNQSKIDDTIALVKENVPKKHHKHFSKIINIHYANDEEMIKFNLMFNSKDNTTNVLSFVADDNPLLLGEIIFSFQKIQSEANEQCKTFKDHLTHLFVHAMLHLLNYDHIEEKERIAMEKLECKILKLLNIKNPYILN